MRRTVTCSLLLALLLMLPSSGVRAQTNDASCFIAKANESRAARGYRQLVVDPSLGSLATLHAQEMARDLRAAPIERDTLLARAPAGALLLGQNVGTGTTCEGLHATFLSYPPGENRILDPSFDSIGVGVASVGDLLYVSEILMQSSTPPPVPRNVPSPSPAPRPTGSPAPSRAPSASPPATDVSPAPTAPTGPTAAPSETAPAPVPPVSPTPSDSAAALDTSKPNRRVPLMVGFALAIVATAALGALVQTRRPKR